MKNRFFAVILILLLIFSVGVLAESDAFTFTEKETYVGAYKNGDMETLAKKLELTKEETAQLFVTNNFEYFAISDDRTTQFSISVYANDLSELTGDASRLDSEALKKFAESLLESSEDTYEIQEQNGIIYVVFNDDIENSKGKNYYSSQYITVANGKFYNLTFISSNPAAKEDIKEIAASFKISKLQKQPISVVYIILIAVVIAAFIAIATVMVIGIIKSLKQKRLEQIEQQENQYEEIIEE